MTEAATLHHERVQIAPAALSRYILQHDLTADCQVMLQ